MSRSKWRPIKSIPKGRIVMVGWNNGGFQYATAELRKWELPRGHGWTHWRPMPRKMVELKPPLT